MKQYNFMAEVPSKSNPNKHYTIKVDESGLFSCSCPSWIFNTRRNRTCKHIDALRTDGMTLDGVGRVITAVEDEALHKFGRVSRGQKIPILCKNYPDQCDACKMRFICWTQREAEFDVNQLREAGIYKDR